MLPNNSDPDRMDLTINWTNSSGTLTPFRSDYSINAGVISSEPIFQETDDQTTATVFITGGEVVIDPDSAIPWEPNPGVQPPHYNNQEVWGAMSDDGSAFTIVAHLLFNEDICDRASIITLTGVRQRAF